MYDSSGGGIHYSAIIGHPPEDRTRQAGDDGYPPRLGENVRVEALVTVDAGLEHATRIGARTWLMKHVHVGHDAQIGDDCELAPGTVICGHARLGDRVRVGVNASILPYVIVGEGARIGAGAVVTKDVPPFEVWAGNPARRLRAANSAAGLVRRESRVA